MSAITARCPGPPPMRRAARSSPRASAHSPAWYAAMPAARGPGRCATRGTGRSGHEPAPAPDPRRRANPRRRGAARPSRRSPSADRAGRDGRRRPTPQLSRRPATAAPRPGPRQKPDARAPRTCSRACAPPRRRVGCRWCGRRGRADALPPNGRACLANPGRRSARTMDGRHGRRGGAAGGRRLHSGCPTPEPLRRTGIRCCARRSRGVHGAGRGRAVHSRRGPRSGCGRPIHAIPGSGSRDHPDAGPSTARTIARTTGSSTNPRGSDGSHEAGDRRCRNAELRSPASSPRGTAGCPMSDIPGRDLPIGDRSCRGNCCRPIADQRCPYRRHDIPDRRNGIRRDCCDIRRGRRGGRPAFRRGIRRRRSGPQKWAARGIRDRSCGIPSCFRSSGRHDRTGSEPPPSSEGAVRSIRPGSCVGVAAVTA